MQKNNDDELSLDVPRHHTATNIATPSVPPCSKTSKKTVQKSVNVQAIEVQAPRVFPRENSLNDDLLSFYPTVPPKDHPKHGKPPRGKQEKYSAPPSPPRLFPLALKRVLISFVAVLGMAIAVPLISLHTMAKVERHAKEEIAQVETQIFVAQQKGENTQQLYGQLLEKQQILDSLLSEKGDRHNRLSGDTLDVFIDEVMLEFYDDDYSIPPSLRLQIKEYVELYSTGIGKKSMEQVMNRRDNYFPYIEQVFREQKVPEVLKYVAMQESLLNPRAESSVGAVGLWQFMPATARLYGLTVDESRDERYEWERATDGAALYFRKLLSLFGKGDGVLLAIASYNAGEHKIQRALGEVEDPLLHRNFGYLYRTSTLLAKETREYVPKILARAIIDRHREYYGF